MNNMVIVVTGGAQGIGRKIAQHFLAAKWKSVIWEIDNKAGVELAKDLNHPDFLNVECNVAIEDEVKAAVRLTLERIGKTDDIARLVWFLSQPENSFITAQNFVIDGGMTRKMIYL